MSENNRMEEMLSALITMVGTIKSDLEIVKEDMAHLREDVNHLREDVNHLRVDVDHLRKDVDHLRKDVDQLQLDMDQVKCDMIEMKVEIKEIRHDGERSHKEVMDKLSLIEADQDFIWDKVVRHEREMVKLKKQYELSNEIKPQI